ncbi:hypothetical protein AB0L82_40945 [Nocardia sp. NPDC052001]|uniref:hypothetical protein n=1 Tax=Nocardia sp. NPDC052001 TaxID=3154853 RepID=UPI00343825EE
MPAPVRQIDHSATNLDSVQAPTDELAAAYRTFLRIRDLEPDPRGIAELVARWDRGGSSDVESRSSVPADEQRIPARYRRLHLVTEAEFAPALPNTTTDVPPEGDRAYRAGYLSEAMALYSRELRVDPLRPQAWAGLRLASSKIFGETYSAVLDDRAEVAAHLYAALGPEVEIMSLLRWLARSDALPTVGNPGESTARQEPETCLAAKPFRE